MDVRGIFRGFAEIQEIPAEIPPLPQALLTPERVRTRKLQ